MLKRLNSNAYLPELLDDMPASLMFNIVDIFSFYNDSPEPAKVAPLPLVGVQRTNDDLIEDVMDVRTIQTRHDEHQKYLVKWQG